MASPRVLRRPATASMHGHGQAQAFRKTAFEKGWSSSATRGFLRKNEETDRGAGATSSKATTMTLFFLNFFAIVDAEAVRTLSAWATFLLLMLTVGLTLGGLAIVFMQAIAGEKSHR